MHRKSGHRRKKTLNTTAIKPCDNEDKCCGQGLTMKDVGIKNNAKQTDKQKPQTNIDNKQANKPKKNQLQNKQAKTAPILQVSSGRERLRALRAFLTGEESCLLICEFWCPVGWQDIPRSQRK